MARVWIINQYASTPDTGYGGRHHYLARELARRGHDVAVVAARHHHLLYGETDTRPEVEPLDGYRFVRLTVPRYGGAHDRRRVLAWFAFSRALRRLPRLIPEVPDAILYSSPAPVGFLGAERLARRFGARLVFDVRDIWPLTLIELGGFSPRHPFIRFLQWVEDRAYRRADRVTSNLPGAVEHMQARGMDPGKFTWVPNGFSAEEARQADIPDPEVAALFPPGTFVVGYAGTFGLANGMEVLLAAAGRLRAHDDIRFVLVGGGREQSRMEARIAREGLGNVTLFGTVAKPRIPAVLRCFDVCFAGVRQSPLYRYGIALNKLFDYLAAGRPVILAADAGSYHPVRDACAGIEVPPDDPEALAGAILHLKALSPEARHDMGEAGQRHADAHHDYARIAGVLERVLLSG